MGNQTFLTDEDVDMNVCEHITMEGDQVTTETLPILTLVEPLEEPDYDPRNTATLRKLELDTDGKPFTCA
jgi:hypothetical protein